MLDQKKRTVRFETSSLLPLKLVLIEAEKELPARTPKEQQDVQDVNEELAMKLIAEMRMSLRRHLHRTAFGAVQVSNPHPGTGDCFSKTRIDIQLEP